MKLDFVLLAAGKGQRMLGNSPKVILPLAGKPMAQHLINTINKIKGSRTIAVIGHQAEKVKNTLVVPRTAKWVRQSKQLGTGHAVKIASSHLRPGSITVVLYGDVPLVRPKTLKKLIKLASDDSLSILTFLKQDPKGYGRIIRSSKNKVEEIVEEKDASFQQRRIKEVNSGILAIKSLHLKKLLPKIKNKNAAKEFYLTDLVSLAMGEGLKIKPFLLKNPDEVLGANTGGELNELERVCQNFLAMEIVESGARVADLKRIDIRGSLKAGKNAFIDVNCVFEGNVILAQDVKVEPNCYIKDSIIGKGSILKANTYIEDSKIGSNCSLGPFARVRGGTELEDFSELGNFVEANRSKVGKSSKAKHLSYLGDASLGSKVNVGAGTITCNYDGKNKHKTKLDDGAFIGSNSSLVAPVKVGKGSYTGAGSVITKNVPPGNLAIGRSKQSNIKRKK